MQSTNSATTTSRRRVLRATAAGAALALAGCLGGDGGAPTATPTTADDPGAGPGDGTDDSAQDNWFYNYGFVSVDDQYRLDYRDLTDGAGDVSMVLEVLDWEGSEGTGAPAVRIESVDGETLFEGSMRSLVGVPVADAFLEVRVAMTGVRVTHNIDTGAFGEAEREPFAASVGDVWRNSHDLYEVIGEETVAGEPALLVNHSFAIGNDEPYLAYELTVPLQAPFVSNMVVHVVDFEPVDEPVAELSVSKS